MVRNCFGVEVKVFDSENLECLLDEDGFCRFDLDGLSVRRRVEKLRRERYEPVGVKVNYYSTVFKY